MRDITQKKGLLIGIGIVMGGVILAILNSPWIKPLIIEDAKIIVIHDNGSCEVETKSHAVLVIWDCGDKQVGEQVRVEYRKDTSLGNIIT